MENNLEDKLNINKINESKKNNNKDNAFNRLYKLQLLLKKESALKELCKIIYFYIY